MVGSSFSVRAARPGDEAGIARVHVATWKATYPGLIAQDYLDALDVAERTRTWARRLGGEAPWMRVFVALDGEAIEGFAVEGPIRQKDPDHVSELYALYVLPEAQKHGHGRRLFEAVGRALLAARTRTMLVWVLEKNPARGFYERMGGVLVKRRGLEIGGVVVPEVGYGWGDVSVFAGSTQRP